MPQPRRTRRRSVDRSRPTRTTRHESQPRQAVPNARGRRGPRRRRRWRQRPAGRRGGRCHHLAVEVVALVSAAVPCAIASSTGRPKPSTRLGRPAPSQVVQRRQLGLTWPRRRTPGVAPDRCRPSHRVRRRGAADPRCRRSPAGVDSCVARSCRRRARSVGHRKATPDRHPAASSIGGVGAERHDPQTGIVDPVAPHASAVASEGTTTTAASSRVISNHESSGARLDG